MGDRVDDGREPRLRAVGSQDSLLASGSWTRAFRACRISDAFSLDILGHLPAFTFTEVPLLSSPLTCSH